MKVFLSWSGQTSRRVAEVLHGWIPTVIQAAQPYFSALDIEKGARWSKDIAEALEASLFGIICLTRENVERPWVNFEAGALSRIVDESRVSPFLFRLDPSDVRGPLGQFQATRVVRDDVWQLVQALNAHLEPAQQLRPDVLDRVFVRAWPDLESELNAIPHDRAERKAETPEAQARAQGAMLAEVLDLVREQHRALAESAATVGILPRMERELASARRRELVYREALETLSQRLDEPHHFLAHALHLLAPDGEPRPLTEESASEAIRRVVQHLVTARRDLETLVVVARGAMAEGRREAGSVPAATRKVRQATLGLLPDERALEPVEGRRPGELLQTALAAHGLSRTRLGATLRRQRFDGTAGPDEPGEGAAPAAAHDPVFSAPPDRAPPDSTIEPPE
jgi:hypothetical protein